MPDIDFEYDSTALADLLGYEKASDYLNLAKASSYQATILKFYGAILILISVSVLLTFVLVLFSINATERISLLREERIWALFLSSIPFLLLGAYVSYKARRIQKEANKQVTMFDHSLTYAAAAERKHGRLNKG